MNGNENRAQIDEDSTRNEATIHGLAVEDVEVLVGLHLGLAVGVDVVFLVNHLPELGADLGLSAGRGVLYLVTALTYLKMDDLSHIALDKNAEIWIAQFKTVFYPLRFRSIHFLYVSQSHSHLRFHPLFPPKP